MATMTMDVKSGYYVAYMHTWRLIVNDSNLGDKFPLDAAYTVSTLSIHSNSPYLGTLGPGTVRNSETAVTGNTQIYFVHTVWSTVQYMRTYYHDW